MVFKKITLFSFIFGIFTILIILRSFDLGNMYKISQFVITYEYGYIKRGLIPSIFSFLGNDLNSQGVSNFFLFLHMLIIIFLYLFFLILILKKKYEFNLFLFILLVYSHSGFLQHYIFDLVRLDIFNLIYFVLFLISLSIKNIYFNFLTFTISTTLIFLTHEAGIIAHIPAMCFIMYLRYFNKVNIFYLNSTILFIFIFFFLIERFLVLISYDIINQIDNINLYLSEIRSNIKLNEDYFVAYTNTFFEQLELAFYGLNNFTKIPFLLDMLIFIILLILSIKVFYSKIFLEINIHTVNIQTASIYFIFPPLLLIIFAGNDYFRFFSMSFTNFFVMIIFYLFYSKKFYALFIENFSKKIIYVYILIIFSLISGPMGIGSYFNLNPIGNSLWYFRGFFLHFYHIKILPFLS